MHLTLCKLHFDEENFELKFSFFLPPGVTLASDEDNCVSRRGKASEGGDGVVTYSELTKSKL